MNKKRIHMARKGYRVRERGIERKESSKGRKDW